VRLILVGDDGEVLDTTEVTRKQYDRISGRRRTYSTAHHALYAARGSARDYPCVDCGRHAEEWSYNHDDPNEEWLWHSSKNCFQWCGAPQFYSPRCKRCHTKFDNKRRAAQERRDRERRLARWSEAVEIACAPDSKATAEQIQELRKGPSGAAVFVVEQVRRLEP
jgi:hypothetical protein